MNRLTTLTAMAAAWIAVLVTPTVLAGEVVDVWVSILPQVEMVKRIGGDVVTVRPLVQPGHSPATYEPTPRQLSALWDADLVFRVGVPFEATLFDKIGDLRPDLRIVNTASGIEMQPIDDHGHHHGQDERLDPHTWLDPELVKIHAANISTALCREVPQHCDSFTHNLSVYGDDLDRVHHQIEELLTPFEGRDLLVFHPSFGYFASRYGLNQVAVETGGKTPSPRRLAELMNAVQESGACAVFVQPQFASGAAQAVAEAAGCRLVELDPLAADHLANLGRMAATIAATYGG